MENEVTGDEYNEMVRLAQDVLIDYGECDFPIDVYRLAEKIGMKVIKYSSLTPEQYMKLAIKTATEKGITVCDKNIDGSIAYYTYYNDNDLIEAACRFTIAHEIKHVVSGDVNKDNLTEKDELLADYFAKCLLAPQAVIIDMGLKVSAEYQECFGLSHMAAEFWNDAVEKRKYKFGENYLFDYEKEFLDLIKKLRNNN